MLRRADAFVDSTGPMAMGGPVSGDSDFDFKSLLSSIAEPEPSNFTGSTPGLAFPTVPQQTRFAHSSSITAMMESHGGMAPPPPRGLTSPPLVRRSSSSSSADGTAMLSSRLRAASDMHQMGMITADEKSLMKNLLLSRDERFRDDLKNAERQNDWSLVRESLRSGKYADFIHRNSSMEILNDLSDVNLSDLPEDLAAVFESAAEESAAARARSGRKRMMSAAALPTGHAPASSAAVNMAAAIPPQQHAIAAKAGGAPEDEMGFGEDSERMAKMRKNERERKRRLAVSQGFDRLQLLLNMPTAAKNDKATILNNAFLRIQDLQKRVIELEAMVNGR